MKRLAALLALAVASACHASAASFDCAKASTAIDKAICSDTALSALDEDLARYYAVVQDQLADAAACLKADQRDWLKSKRNACGGKTDCLRKAYLARLATLDGLQPGASAVKTMELPVAATLVTIIPPEGDGARSSSRKPVSFEGTLLHEGEDMNNMGLAVRGKDGKSHAFVLDMNIGNSPSHQTIQSLIEARDKASYRVRGLALPEGSLADGDCRFVYRLP